MFTKGPWAFNRMDSAEEFARLKGETLEPHEGYYRTNSGAWIVTAGGTDDDGYSIGGPIAEVTFKGTAKRGEAYRASDPEGQANAHLIAAAPDLYEADEEALDAFIRLRDDLADEDAELHAQRIAVIDLEIERLTNALAKAQGRATIGGVL